MPDAVQSVAGNVTSNPSAMAGIMEKLKSWSAENPRLAKSLMAGLGSAAVGGGLTAMSKRKNESRGERRKRILRNALLAGGAGAGAVGLGDYSIGQFKTVDPVAEDPILGPGRELAAAGGGLAGLFGSRAAGKLQQDTERRGIIGGIREELNNSKNLTPANKRIKDIASTVPGADEAKGIKRMFTGGTSSKALNDMSRIKGMPGGTSPLDLLLKRRGVTARDLENAGHVAPWAGKGDTWRFLKGLGKREINKTLGTSKLQRAGRLGTIGASAAIPYALVSQLMSNPELASNTLGEYKKLLPQTGADSADPAALLSSLTSPQD